MISSIVPKKSRRRMRGCLAKVKPPEGKLSPDPGENGGLREQTEKRKRKTLCLPIEEVKSQNLRKRGEGEKRNAGRPGGSSLGLL